ncbi:hypothetical protein ACOSQ4_003029 [Xanthoceras sorbifolium]
MQSVRPVLCSLVSIVWRRSSFPKAKSASIYFSNNIITVFYRKILMKEVAQGKKKLEHPYLNETVVQTTFIPEQKKSISVISSKI